MLMVLNNYRDNRILYNQIELASNTERLTVRFESLKGLIIV